MLLSRRPILSSRNFPLPKLGLAENHSIQQGILEGVIDTDSGPLRLYSTHLSHLSPETRLPQVRAILDLHARRPMKAAHGVEPIRTRKAAGRKGRCRPCRAARS
jgi:endonuclease/exonuclease/phosphatase family metal-dependent hydrolase